ncbi:MAG: MBL fold metallo-hydrolase [Planctomycetes bacterium]|nr:MBL fold metallo-hydrolase [Planctomycetota bacterium]
MLIQIRLGISNVFLLRDSRPILVDTGRPHEGPRIVAALEREGVKLTDLALILHTHGHWDHCGSTWRLKQGAPAVPVVIHEGDAEKMNTGSNGILRPTCLTARLAKPFLDRRFPPVEPDIVITSEFSLSAFGVDARIIHTPGHTAGSISVLTGEGDAIVGDLLMGGYLGGRILRHVPTYHYFAEDFAMLRSSLERLVREHAPARIYAGHGGPLSCERIRKRLLIDRAK